MNSLAQSALDSLKGARPYIVGGSAAILAVLMYRRWASGKRRR